MISATNRLFQLNYFINDNLTLQGFRKALNFPQGLVQNKSSDEHISYFFSDKDCYDDYDCDDYCRSIGKFEGGICNGIDKCDCYNTVS